MKRSLFLISLNLFIFTILAQTVTIKGNDKSRAGKELVLYKYTDQITYEKDTICKCIINETGDFSCTFSLQETSPIYIPLESLKGMFYAEPDKVFSIKLPEVKDKKTGDKLNPFFEDETVYLTIENLQKTDLNNVIRRFDFMYNDYIDARFNEIYKLAKHSGVDTVIKMIDTTFADNGNQYFNNYKKYKFAMLRYFAYIRNEKILTKEFFRNQQVLYNNSAYMDLFNQAYKNYFTAYSKTSEGADVVMNITQQKSSRELKKTLSKNISLDDKNFKEFVILKGLHDGFYSGDFNKNVVLQTLDSLEIESTNETHKKIAESIKNKIINRDKILKINSFEFLDLDSNKFDFEKFKGKFIYIGFCSIINFACKEELELLKKLYEKKEKSLEIVTVYVDDNRSQVKEFTKKNIYKWQALTTCQKSASMKEFNIKAYPDYYLIGPDGKVISSSAKTVKEGFEEYFIRSFAKKTQ